MARKHLILVSNASLEIVSGLLEGHGIPVHTFLANRGLPSGLLGADTATTSALIAT